MTKALPGKTLLMILAAGVVAGAGICVFLFRPAPEPRALKTGIYVWQQEWSPGVGEGIARARDRAGHFYVYAARLEIKNDEVRVTPNRLDWAALARAGRPVTVVARAGEGLAPLLRAGRAAAVAETIQAALETIKAEAAASSATLAGLQLDYDCPTARLADYRALIEALRPGIGATELSITALPTWMGSRQFGPLVKALPEYVLQVHGIDPPTTIDRPVVLCDCRRIEPWLKRASSFGVPFHVALPTYGYRVIFDEKGRYVSLLAESPRAALCPGYREQRVQADPAELAGVMRRLRLKPPRGCLGVIWFRLPVDGDRLNWPWPTLAAVMDGRAPSPRYAAELRTPSPGLYEVWVANCGEGELDQEIRIPVDLDPKRLLAHDLMEGFNEDTHGELRGPAPPLGPARLAAWYRMDSPLHNPPPALGKVEVLP